MKIYTSVEQLIGGTPLLELCRTEQALELEARLLVKLEKCSPGGSVKDRVALQMIRDAEEQGLLKAGATIIEATSGSTGIGLACIGAARGYRTIIVMPDSMSVERQRLMRAYGAEVVLTPGAEGMAGSVRKAEELARTIPGSFIPAQFDNLSNPAAHLATTGPEIWEDTGGAVDIFVAGVGTGGTITGAGRYLKSKKPGLRVVAVEPEASPLLSGGKAGPHPLQGIGANFVPSILDTEVYDSVFTVSGREAYAACRDAARREGILVGITSGAAIHAAVELAKRPENAGKTIVALLPDSGERYLSTPGFIGE